MVIVVVVVTVVVVVIEILVRLVGWLFGWFCAVAVYSPVEYILRVECRVRDDGCGDLCVLWMLLLLLLWLSVWACDGGDVTG